MSCVHLLLGLPLPLLPSHVPSKNSFSNVLCRLMWPKYDSFCFLIRFRSCGAFTPSCSRTLAFVFLSVHEILSNSNLIEHSLWSMPRCNVFLFSHLPLKTCYDCYFCCLFSFEEIKVRVISSFSKHFLFRCYFLEEWMKKKQLQTYIYKSFGKEDSG